MNLDFYLSLICLIVFCIQTILGFFLLLKSKNIAMRLLAIFIIIVSVGQLFLKNIITLGIIVDTTILFDLNTPFFYFPILILFMHQVSLVKMKIKTLFLFFPGIIDVLFTLFFPENILNYIKQLFPFLIYKSLWFYIFNLGVIEYFFLFKKGASFDKK